jgi:thioredoxin-dependent peroxiredoxin
MITLKPGDKAPSFTAVDSYGKQVSLKDFKGKKLVIFFYPEDDSPTCTIEACNLRDNSALLRSKGFDVIGVSPDGPEQHQHFINKFTLPFTLIPDPDHKIMDKFGVWSQKKLFGHEYMGVLRTTFVLDENGTILKVFLKPRNKAHAEEILANVII